MHLILDLLYIVKDYFEPLLYYQISNYYFIYCKTTQKYIQISNNNEFIWMDMLNKTSCYNFGGYIFDHKDFDIEISDKAVTYNGFYVNTAKRTKKQFKLPMREKDFLFNNIRLIPGSFESYEKELFNKR